MKKKKAGELTLLDFKTNSRAKIIETVWSGQKDKYTEQWNRELKTKPLFRYGQ